MLVSRKFEIGEGKKIEEKGKGGEKVKGKKIKMGELFLYTILNSFYLF